MFHGLLYILPKLNGFQNWKKKEQIKHHRQLKNDVTSCQEAEGIKDRFRKPEATLPCRISKEKEVRLEKYKHILLTIARVVHMLGKQGLPFRGHRDNLKDIHEEKNNPGNFIEVLKMISIGDSILKEHLGGRFNQQEIHIFVVAIAK